MSLESQFKSQVLLEKIEPLTVIKNEPEIGMDQDIISAEIKDEIDIEYHIISEDLIKNEPIPNNLLKSEHLESVETQIFIQTENAPFIKTKFENIVKTEDISDGNLSVVSGSTHKKRKAKMDNYRLKYHCNKCTYKTSRRACLKRHKLIHLKPEEIQYFYCYHCSYKAKRKANLRVHILGHFRREQVPFHCYICDFVTKKRDLIIEHFKKHPEHIRKYELTQESEIEIDDQYLKYQCDKCTFKTSIKCSLKSHKLIHLKPEEIQWFYCYHCSLKAKRKAEIKVHILRHFKREEVPFHCYICDFVTKKRDLIIEHFKKHPEHVRKYELAQGSEVEIDDQYLKYQCDKCTYKTSRKCAFKLHILIHLKPEEILQWFYCYHCSYKASRKFQLNDHILRHFKNEVVKFHCYICDFVTKKRNLIMEHFKKHPEHVSKCDETDYEINLSKLTPKIKKSESAEIQYFYCYHCSHKSKQKCHLKAHILRHFKREEVPFHCYICNFVTKKRDLIMEHFKKHPEYVSKCDETDYEINLLQLTPKIKKSMDKSEKITEKRRKQKRDSKRRQRERIKSNPNLYEEAKAKQRENYHKRKKKQ